MSDRARKPPEQLSQKGRDYIVACISMYPETEAALESMVAELRAAGVRGMSKSWLIREALAQVDLRALAARLTARPPTPTLADPALALPGPSMSATIGGKISSHVHVHGKLGAPTRGRGVRSSSKASAPGRRPAPGAVRAED